MAFTYGQLNKKQFKRSLFIGLGGSGLKIITTLKRDFIEQYGQVPVTKAFLGFDTDNDLPMLESRADGSVVRLDPNSEFYHLKVMSPRSFIKSSPEVQKWIQEPPPDEPICAGTGAIRQAGRVGLFAHTHEVFGSIRNAVDRLYSVTLPDKMSKQGYTILGEEIEVYICGSIAGGTGSGTFLDVAIWCRHNMRPDTMIYGVLLGPWIYRNLGATFRTPANAYSSMMELDYLMTNGHVQKTKKGYAEDYMVRYDKEEIVIERPPFSMVYLVDGINQKGSTIDEPKELIKFISEGLFLSTSDSGRYLRSGIDNILTYLSVANKDIWEGKFNLYSSFGSAAAIYPADQYAKRAFFRFSEKILEKMVAILTQYDPASEEPTQEDWEEVKGFISDNNLTQNKSGLNLDQIFDPDTVRKLRIQDPMADDMHGGYPKILEERVDTKFGTMFEDVISEMDSKSSDDRTKNFGKELPEAVRAFIQTGSRNKSESVADERRRVRIRLLLDSINSAIEAVNNERGSIQKKINECDKAAEDELQKVKDLIDGKKFYTSNSSLKEKVTGPFSKYVSNANEKLRWKIDLERATRYHGILLDISSTLSQTLVNAAGQMSRNEELAKLINETKRIIRVKSQAIQDTAIDSGLSDFQVLVDLENEETVNEDSLATAEAARLLEEIKSSGKPVSEITIQDVIDVRMSKSGAEFEGKRAADTLTLFTSFSGGAQPAAQGLIHYIAPAAWAYANKHYRENIKILDLVKEKNDLSLSSGSRPYIEKLISSLEEKGQPLWHYDKGILNKERNEKITTIVSIGTENVSEAENVFSGNSYFDKLKANIVANGDPHRITLIQLTASLPAWAISQMHDCRERYNNQFNPPLHSSRFFEMNAESIIPAKADENKAFRVLSLAILPEINLISDDIPEKGKKGRFRLLFELKSDPDYPMQNLTPTLGDKFQQAYSYLLRHETVREQVLQKLISRLTEMRENDPNKLREALDRQIASLSKEVENRQMEKILTWHCMRREIGLINRLKLWEGDYREFFAR